MKIRELFTRIGFDINDKPLKQLDSGIKQVKKSILLMSGAVIGASGVLFGLAKNIANIGDDARKTAQALGLTTESLQELEYAASIGGVKQAEFRTALRQLSNSAMDASIGLETYKRAYDALGISVTDSNGILKSTDQLLMELSEKFSKMPDSARKTALANDIFGRSGARLIPWLNQGAAGVDALRQEAIDLGYVMSDEAGKASEEFNDSLTRLFALLRGIRIQVGNYLIPVITKYIKRLIEWGKRQKGIITQLKQTVDGFGGLIKMVKYATYALAGFLALKFVYGIGLIAQGVYGLVAGFTALGTAGMLATVKAAALPLIIGVAIAALILALEDVWSFFQGKDSITGLIVDAFKNKYPEAIKATKEALQEVLGLFKEVAKSVFTSPGQAVSEVGGQVGRATGKAYPEEGSFWDKLKFFAKSVQFGHTNMPPSSYQTVNSPNVSVNAPVTVNVPSGIPAQDIGPRVQAGIKDAMGEMLRQTHWATRPQVEY